MKTVPYWRWRVPLDYDPKRTHVTRWMMTEEQALARWPTAVREGPAEMRSLPETQEEIAGMHTSGFLRGEKIKQQGV
ncbi:hypothetical protein C1M51_02720 [Methylibium sp. Pch-M]|uniref:hypothetical protein n=1 Tax=Methylibium sp. Pch-M TaxID=2082386 RepID=UPI00101056F0|nr:hypothetical protein [Methylibium sp. Pch-M]QAZ38418.1 hypothetical protein C1M51_02720 [Methylibium sp. Pch-M]